MLKPGLVWGFVWVLNTVPFGPLVWHFSVLRQYSHAWAHQYSRYSREPSARVWSFLYEPCSFLLVCPVSWTAMASLSSQLHHFNSERQPDPPGHLLPAPQPGQCDQAVSWGVVHLSLFILVFKDHFSMSLNAQWLETRYVIYFALLFDNFSQKDKSGFYIPILARRIPQNAFY